MEWEVVVDERANAAKKSNESLVSILFGIMFSGCVMFSECVML